MANRLIGQAAWISGAASGIGEATARLFAAEGASVALADVQAARGGQIADDINRAGGRAIFLETDVSDETQVRDSIARAAVHFGRLNILVNCAALVHVVPLHEYDGAAWDRLMGVNVKGIFLAIKHGLLFLRENERSYMVNVGSVSSFVGQALTPAYVASKHAVLGLSRSIALDYASIGLRCNCVCPGITDTPLLREHLDKSPDPDATLANRVRRVPTKAAMSPEAIARAIVYLSCEDSAGVTGTSLVVDGGYLAAGEWDAG